MTHVATTIDALLDRFDPALLARLSPFRRKPKKSDGPPSGTAAPAAEPSVVAVRLVRAWRGDLGLVLKRRETFTYPNAGNLDRRLTSYADDDGNEYWIDHDRDAIVQMGPMPDRHHQALEAGPHARLPVAELRRRALQAAENAVPGFDLMRRGMHPREDNVARETYYFRWEDYSSPLPESAPPPFVQVGIAADGTVTSFIDALIGH